MNDDKKKKLSSAVQRTVINYVYHALFGASFNAKSLEDDIHSLLFAGSSGRGLVTEVIQPLPAPFCCCLQSKRDKAISNVLDFIMKSPSMENYVLSDENNHMSREDYARLLLDLTGIAGIIGSSALCLSILTELPDNYPINLDNQREVFSAILEVARKKAPVNNVNIILHEKKELKVNGHTYTFPPGTCVSANLALANLDSNVFYEPEKFNPKRNNLFDATLTFNHVGFNPVGSGTRQCPGRNFAMKMAADLLIESRREWKCKEYTPPTTIA